MEIKTIVTVIIAGMLGAVVFAAMLPVFEDTASAETTFKNDGYFYLKKYTSDEEFSISWDSANPSNFTINGEAFTFTNNAGLGLSVVLGESFYLRLNDGNARMSFNNNGTYVNTSDTYTTMTLTYTGGTVSATNGNASRTVSDVSEIYAISDSGEYVMKKSNSVAYLNSGSEIIGDSEIYASGQSSSGNNNLFWHLEGTIDNISYPNVFSDTLTVTNQEIHGAYSTTYNDLYELSNLTFTVTTSGSVVYNITASYFVVPYEVTAEKTIHADAPTTALLNLLPVLIAIGLIVGIAGAIFVKRM